LDIGLFYPPKNDWESPLKGEHFNHTIYPFDLDVAKIPQLHLGISY